MKTTGLQKIIAKDGFDLTIHQYCNGFCKYCPVTEVCANFAVLCKDLDWGKPQKQTYKIQGAILEDKYLYAMEHILDFADKIGFNLDGIALKPVADQYLESNQLIATALKCSKLSIKNLSKVLNVYEETQIKIKTKLVKAISKSKSQRKVAEMYISIEYIEFLSIILPGKLAALFAKEVGSDMEKNGFGRMIIESIMQILCAWNMILEQIPNERDRYMDLLLDYYWIMASVSASFPKAAMFHRHGLDTDTEGEFLIH